MRRLHCVFQDGLILGIWMCPDERFYYHIAEADAERKNVSQRPQE